MSLLKSSSASVARHGFPLKSLDSVPIHRLMSSQAAATASAMTSVLFVGERPTALQLRRLFISAMVPMVGFGIVDQTVMLQAGNAIDCTIGVTFGLSTLTAAAFGQICSDASGVLFGGTLETLMSKLGLPKANLSNAQRALPLVQRIKLAGSFFGIITGCSLGLMNLFFIDTNRSNHLKLRAFSEEQEFEFLIEASNAIRDDATALRVTGPDVDGLLASMTAALAVRGCSLVELHAQRKGNHNSCKGDDDERLVEDVFYVINRNTGEPFDDEDLEGLARELLDSTRTPMLNVNSVKAAMHELESTNSYLKARIRKLEEVVYAKQITVIPSVGASAPTSSMK